MLSSPFNCDVGLVAMHTQAGGGGWRQADMCRVCSVLKSRTFNCCIGNVMSHKYRLISVYVLVRVCVWDGPWQQEFVHRLVNVDNVTNEAASIQSSFWSLGPGSKNGVKPWVELNIINNNMFVFFLTDVTWIIYFWLMWLNGLYGRLNIFVLFYWVLGGFCFWSNTTNYY